MFTLIIGKNGTGKSSLLRSVVINFLQRNISPNNLRLVSDISPSKQIDFETAGSLNYSYEPTKIICASTSPFDKFPLPRKTLSGKYYCYLGLRGLPSQNLGLAYMSKIIYTLINASAKSADHASSITAVLEYLEYSPQIYATFIANSPRLFDILVTSDEDALRENIKEHLDNTSYIRTETEMFLKQLSETDGKTFRQVRKAAIRLTESAKRNPIVVTIEPDGVRIPSHNALMAEDLSLLGTFGLVKLKDVELRKSQTYDSIRMTDMSSGEQSVIMSFLGIGSQLEDGALVCIDEPEVCLHPEWQEKYIHFLSNIFSHFTGCHFLIATHSPQIVAELPKDRCYIMDMESGEAKRSIHFTHKSIDYQLASLFKAPGFKNEYLSRIAVNIFIKVGKEKAFDAETRAEYKVLDNVFDLLSKEDPLREIIESIRLMYGSYGRH